MQPFEDTWWGHRSAATDTRHREPSVRTYRVDYQAGAESGHITLRTDAHLTASLATQARALLEARGLEASIRRIVPVA